MSNDNNNPNNAAKSTSQGEAAAEESWTSYLDPRKIPARFQRFLSERDDGRIERLKQCQELKNILQDCRDQKPDRKALENVPMGIRSTRMFHWRDETPTNPKSCVREEHALYACRAVCLRCGSDLVNLRDCFRDLGVKKVLKSSYTYYDGTAASAIGGSSKGTKKSNKDPSKIPCSIYQQQMGECIKVSSQKLHERIKKRKQALEEKVTLVLEKKKEG